MGERMREEGERKENSRCLRQSLPSSRDLAIVNLIPSSHSAIARKRDERRRNREGISQQTERCQSGLDDSLSRQVLSALS